MRKTGKKEIIPADIVFLAMGFVHPELEGLVQELKISVDKRQNIAVDNNLETNVNKVFACGDAITGASLVVKAMASGRSAAQAIDRFLSKKQDV